MSKRSVGALPPQTALVAACPSPSSFRAIEHNRSLPDHSLITMPCVGSCLACSAAHLGGTNATHGHCHNIGEDAAGRFAADPSCDPVRRLRHPAVAAVACLLPQAAAETRVQP